MELKRVVITGMGAYSPLGNDMASIWQALRDGRSGAAAITRFDATNFKTRFACEVKDFDAKEYLGHKEARKLDRFAQLAVVAADLAIADAKLKDSAILPERIGVVVASGIGGMQTFQDEVREFVLGDGVPHFNPFFIPRLILDIAAGYISMRHGFQGPNFAVVSACASSTNAIVDAYNYIRLGYADAFVTGGAEAVIIEAGVGGFSAIKALSERNDEPTKASRPFDRDRDGFVMGEGAAILVLEERESALRRGAPILAEIIGCGLSGDAYHLTAPHPEGKGAMLSMKNAIDCAGIRVQDVDYINVHGTSTPLGDEIELKAIENLFGEHIKKLSISATKSMTGHLLGAAGAMEAIISVLAIQNSIVPPTINLENIDPKINPNFNLTPLVAEHRNIEIAMSNTFGFGGHNATILLKKHS